MITYKNTDGIAIFILAGTDTGSTAIYKCHHGKPLYIESIQPTLREARRIVETRDLKMIMEFN